MCVRQYNSCENNCLVNCNAICRVKSRLFFEQIKLIIKPYKFECMLFEYFVIVYFTIILRHFCHSIIKRVCLWFKTYTLCEKDIHFVTRKTNLLVLHRKILKIASAHITATYYNVRKFVRHTEEFAGQCPACVQD